MHYLLWAAGIQWFIDHVFGIIEQETLKTAGAACRLKDINVESCVSFCITYFIFQI